MKFLSAKRLFQTVSLPIFAGAKSKNILKTLSIVRRAVTSLAIVASAALLTHCEQPDLVGIEVQPASDFFGSSFTDTSTVVAFSEKMERTRTDELVNNLLGSMNDPVFGIANAAFYTQFRLSANNVNFGSNPQSDSIVLRLHVKDVYGDTSTVHRIRVYEVSQPFYRDSSYYSDTYLQVYGTVLAEQDVVFNKKDSVTVGTQKFAPHIPLRMHNSVLGNRLINASGTDALKDNNGFVTFFRGIYVTVETVQGTGSMAYLDLVSSVSQLSLYYHNDSTSSLQYNFPINESCARFTQFFHNRYIGVSPILHNQIINKDTFGGDSLLYLQSMAGIRLNIRFPHIRNFESLGKIMINKAELVLRLEDFTTTPYAPPVKLVMARLNGTGGAEFMPDDPYPYGTNYFGGHYDASKLEYRFRLNQHIYNLIQGRYQDHGVVILPTGSMTSASRAILHGADRSSHPLRLHITYTKIQ